jgi:hypothetical protein
MGAARILAIVLIVAGAASLAFGTFTYTRKTHEAKLGPMEISIKDRESISIPSWAGGGMILAGVLLLVVRSGKR